jgi:virginiamycin A acetyltransferase
MREALKSFVRGLATVLILPALASYRLRAAVVGSDRALESSAQAFALIPGLIGQYLRRAFLAQVLAECDATATIEFGVLFSQAGARIGRQVYVGPHCHLGLVHLEAGVLLAASVHIPSGAQTHGSADLDTPIRDQPGQRSIVRIGAGSWIGSAAVVMADVGRDTIVGAGAVVTRPIPDRVIAGGVPARVIKRREDADVSPDAVRVGTTPSGAVQTDAVQTDAVRSSQ